MFIQLKLHENRAGCNKTSINPAIGDEDAAWEEDAKSKELYVEARSGTLFDFFDEFEPSSGKHVIHRSTLSRQKAGSQPGLRARAAARRPVRGHRLRGERGHRGSEKGTVRALEHQPMYTVHGCVAVA